MKKYTDQGKVDTRSGFGAHAFLPVLFAMIVVSSCFSPLFENEPYGSVRIIQYISEYELNGEYVCDTLDLEYSRFHYKHWYFPMFFISLKGVAYLKNAENHTIDLYGIDIIIELILLPLDFPVMAQVPLVRELSIHGLKV